MKEKQDLRQLLERIDHHPYPAYKDTQGTYRFDEYLLHIEHVQGDPFAAPSKIKIELAARTAAFPHELYDTREKRVALQDYLLRQFGKEIAHDSFRARGSGKSGLMTISSCGQEILERSACTLEAQTGNLTLRMEIGFPANGRTIQSGELIKILYEFLPKAVHKTLRYQSLDAKELADNAALAEDQAYIRNELKKRGLVAWIADGAVLPRESGVSGKPMKNAVAWKTPENTAMAITLDLPHHGKLRGMGIPRGVTLIVGGGYHGKSTLLEALELGVYNHIAGDGREYVITNDDAVKTRAEDGRSIQHVDISMFIRNLPNGRDTRVFCTEDASGSTSQAANVVEAMEAGSHVLLIDEDTSATNFMIRDELMQRVVHKDKEPIIPYIDRIRELYEEYGISTILVAGSSGAYFAKADHIIQMDSYVPYEITERAKKIAAEYAPKSENTEMTSTVNTKDVPDFNRKIKPDREWQQDRLKLKTAGLDSIFINHDCIDMRYVEQLVDPEQLQTLALMLQYTQKHLMDGRKTLQTVVGELWQILEKQGLAGISEGRVLSGHLAMTRPQELFACIDRYRKLHL